VAIPAAHATMSRPSSSTAPPRRAQARERAQQQDFPVPLPPSSAMNSPARIVQSKRSIERRPGTATRKLRVLRAARSLADPADLERRGFAHDALRRATPASRRCGVDARTPAMISVNGCG
jgi:hypothetical protein